MKVVILERDPIGVNVVRLLEHKMFSEFTKVLTVEEKPYKCKIFVRNFTSTYVQARERIHTGQKPSLNHSKTNWTTHWTEII